MMNADLSNGALSTTGPLLSLRDLPTYNSGFLGGIAWCMFTDAKMLELNGDVTDVVQP